MAGDGSDTGRSGLLASEWPNHGYHRHLKNESEVGGIFLFVSVSLRFHKLKIALKKKAFLKEHTNPVLHQMAVS